VDVETIKRGLDISPETRIILNVSRYVPHKNHQHLIKIAQQVVRIRNDVVFLLVGDGPLHQEIKGQVEKLQLTQHFRFIRGMTSIVPLFRASDLFLFPSLMEGFGIVLVEAAASGLPVVVSRIPGILESSRASPAPTLVEPEDTAGFVRAILDNLERPKTDFAPVPSLLKQFDISTSIERLISVYNEMKGT
jgi:glycosyltransferase involved in cell wall biosynthesis